MPWSISSGIDPRAVAITGVPHASASTTIVRRAVEVDQVEQRTGGAQRVRADRAPPTGPLEYETLRRARRDCSSK